MIVIPGACPRLTGMTGNLLLMCLSDVAKVRLFGAEFWVAFFYLERDKIGLM